MVIRCEVSTEAGVAGAAGRALAFRRQLAMQRRKIMGSKLLGAGMILATYAAAAQPALYSFTRLDGYDILRSATADGEGGVVAVGSLDATGSGWTVGLIRREDARGRLIIDARIG